MTKLTTYITKWLAASQNTVNRLNTGCIVLFGAWLNISRNNFRPQFGPRSTRNFHKIGNSISLYPRPENEKKNNHGTLVYKNITASILNMFTGSLSFHVTRIVLLLNSIDWLIVAQKSYGWYFMCCRAIFFESNSSCFVLGWHAELGF